KYKDIPSLFIKKRGDNFMEVAFEKNGYFYALGVISHRDEMPQLADLTAYIDTMASANDFANEVKENSEKQFESKLNVPHYFADNLNFQSLVIQDDTLSINYKKYFEKNGQMSMVG